MNDAQDEEAEPDSDREQRRLVDVIVIERLVLGLPGDGSDREADQYREGYVPEK